MSFKYLVIIIIGLLFVKPNNCAAQISGESKHKILLLEKNIAEGKEKEINPLYDKNQIKVVQLTLRSESKLETHKVNVPILIQCISGNGELMIQNGDNHEIVSLNPGITVVVESDVLHDVIAKPEISIMLIKFPKENE